MAMGARFYILDRYSGSASRLIQSGLKLHTADKHYLKLANEWTLSRDRIDPKTQGIFDPRISIAYTLKNQLGMERINSMRYLCHSF